MPFLAKLKGAKKAAEDHKAKVETQENKPVVTAPYRHVPTHAATDAMISSPGGWKVEDIAHQNIARLNRIGSDYSTRPSTSHSTASRPARPTHRQTNSDSSLDFTPSAPAYTMPVRSVGSSMKSSSISRNTSFQSLEKVIESNGRDQEPVFAAALLANRAKSQRSSRSSARSSLAKSPLSSVESSAESSPAGSETNSPTGSSSGQIEAVAYTHNTTNIHPAYRLGQMPKAQPERKYFSHNKEATTEFKEVSVPEPVIKKQRFSFIKKSGGAVAAH